MTERDCATVEMEGRAVYVECIGEGVYDLHIRPENDLETSSLI